MGRSGSGHFRPGLGSAVGQFGSEWGGLVQAGLQWVGSQWGGVGRVASDRVWVLLWVGSVLNGLGWFRPGLSSAVGRFGSEWGGLVQAGLERVGSLQAGFGFCCGSVRF